ADARARRSVWSATGFDGLQRRAFRVAGRIHRGLERVAAFLHLALHRYPFGGVDIYGRTLLAYQKGRRYFRTRAGDARVGDKSDREEEMILVSFVALW